MKYRPPVMVGKNCLITGGNRGIGKQIALELAKLGATVGIITRNQNKGEEAVNDIISESKNNQIILFTTDLASLAQVRRLSKEVKNRFSHIDVLINNAAVLLRKREATEDGFEKTLAINHLGSFLLTILLFDTLRRSGLARIVNISSDGHRKASIDIDDLDYEKRKYNGFHAYYQSKLLNILFTYELAHRLASLQPSRIVVNALDPGRVNTHIGKNYDAFFYRIFSKVIRPSISISTQQRALAAVYIATSSAFAGMTGKYFIKGKIGKSSSISYDRSLQRGIWTLSEEYVGIKSEEYGVGALIE